MAKQQQTRGFIYAATGSGYTELAVRAMQSLRSVHPGAQIDLFTDQKATPPGFDRVHPIKVGKRPKFEALLNSRFDRTIYLDADTIAIAPMSDVFDILDRFDIAAAQDQAPNSENARKLWRQPIPAAFPQLNSGVLAVSGSPETRQLLAAADQAIRQGPLKTDQPILRELIYLSDLRLAVLPGVYNAMFFAHLEAQDHLQMAPRLLHAPRLQNHLNGHGPQIFGARQAVGPMIWQHIQAMQASDMTLGAAESTAFRPLMDQGPLGRLRRFIHNSLRDIARRRPPE